MTDSECWLMTFLLFASNPDAFETLKEDLKKEKRKEDLQQNCPDIEWEQDMNARIPFCRLTNDFCDLHCME